MASSIPSSSSLDQWRLFFRSSNTDIFEVIERAIMVAATDRPDDFGRLRDRIAEKLFSYKFTHKSDLRQPKNQIQKEEAEESKPRGEAVRITDDPCRELITNFNYEAEALTNEIEEESQLIGEVFRIKEVLMNEHDESEEVLFDSLRRLQLMRLSFETLGVTEIGKAVSGLKKHKSKKIRRIACTLIEAWKALVDQWLNATSAINDGTTPDSVVLSAVDEDEGLPFPPLDEGAILAATQPGPMELSKIFDGMDEDGNLEIIKETERKKVGKVLEKRLRPSVDAPVVEYSRDRLAPPTVEKPLHFTSWTENPTEPLVARAKEVSRQRRTEEASISNIARPNRPSEPVSRPGKPAPSEMAARFNPRPQLQQKRGIVSSNQEKPRNDDFDPSVSARLEMAKRKLHEGYQLAENAKKQRTIQVMELHDLPRQSSSQRHPQQQKAPQKNKLRSLFHGRRTT